MARRPRFALPGWPQHVIQRGNNRQPTFYTDDDCRFYLECLDDAARKYGCRVHAYVLMTNHVHLLATPQEGAALSRTMQHLGRRYVRYINDRYGRSGTLWEDRFKASLVDTEVYLMRCCRYIELNPVRASIVARAEDYRWSSHRCHAFGTPDVVLSPHDECMRLGGNPYERQAAYRSLFETELTGTELESITFTVNQGWPLGSDRFKSEIEQAFERKAGPRRASPRPRSRPKASTIGEPAELKSAY